jgi:hypothetical protein
LVAGLTVGVAQTAQAAKQWGAIRTGPDGKWQMIWGKPTSGELAYFGLWGRCGEGCKLVLRFTQRPPLNLAQAVTRRDQCH